MEVNFSGPPFPLLFGRTFFIILLTSLKSLSHCMPSATLNKGKFICITHPLIEYLWNPYHVPVAILGSGYAEMTEKKNPDSYGTQNLERTIDL